MLSGAEYRSLPRVVYRSRCILGSLDGRSLIHRNIISSARADIHLGRATRSVHADVRHASGSSDNCWKRTCRGRQILTPPCWSIILARTSNDKVSTKIQSNPGNSGNEPASSAPAIRQHAARRRAPGRSRAGSLRPRSVSIPMHVEWELETHP